MVSRTLANPGVTRICHGVEDGEKFKGILMLLVIRDFKDLRNYYHNEKRISNFTKWVVMLSNASSVVLDQAN